MQLDLPELPTDTTLATVVFDASRASHDGSEAIEARWRTLSAQLQDQGASPEMVAVLAESGQEPTGAAGEHGRILVANSKQVLVDRVTSAPPAHDTVTVQRGPDVFALAQASDDAVRWALVEVDRSGADLTTGKTSRVNYGTQETVEGDHNELTKNTQGGNATRRIHARAEDSWERNAEQITDAVSELRLQESPELVFIAGDVRMVTLIKENAGEELGAILHELTSGSRAPGVNDEAFTREFDGALEVWRARRREEVLDRYREQVGRDGAAVTGLGALFDVLRKGQAEEVLISEEALKDDSRLRTSTAWIGPEPMQGALARAEVQALGVDDAQQVTADVAIGRLVLGTDAGVTLVDAAAFDAIDGVAAILRWDDDSTPSHALSSEG